MDWHSLTPEQTARELGTNLSQGISEQNAKNLLAKNGKNLLNIAFLEDF